MPSYFEKQGEVSKDGNSLARPPADPFSNDHALESSRESSPGPAVFPKALNQGSANSDAISHANPRSDETTQEFSEKQPIESPATGNLPPSKEQDSTQQTSDDIEEGAIKRTLRRWRNNYYITESPPIVLPSPPNDKEKYSYFRMNRWFIMTAGVFSLCALSAGMILFLKASAIFAWYGIYAALTIFYLGTSYGIVIIGKRFKKSTHEQIVRENPVLPETCPTIDVYLPICREPLEVLRNTWGYVTQLQYPAGKLQVYILDDGAQEEVAMLAQEFGFQYICRDDRPHLKKAGNLRWAFARTTGDFFTVFDADFCPRADFLMETIPHHIANPKCAILQTPQYFRSLKEQTWTERGAGSVPEFFYRVVQTTRNTWGASICVGSNAVYRREALAPVGGTAEIVFSEDVHTGFHAVHRGWDVTYVPIVLACGVCPDTPRALFSQQMRWCFGSTTLLTNPEFYKSNLTKMQKFCYITGFLYYTATAMGVFLNPLPGPLLLWLRPQYFKYYNLFFAVPSVIYGVFVFRFWARSNYTLDVQTSTVIMGWAYVNSIKDRLVGQKLNWAASGDGKAHKNNKYRNMRILAWFWVIATNTALISGVAYRISTGFPWYNFVPLLFLDAFTLFCQHRFLLFTNPT